MFNDDDWFFLGDLKEEMNMRSKSAAISYILKEKKKKKKFIL